MKRKYKRRHYFIHPSSQLRYIAFSIIPALVMTLYCVYYLNMTGDAILRLSNDRIFANLSAIKKTLPLLEKAATKDTEDDVLKLRNILDSFEDTVLLEYQASHEKWNQARVIVFIGLFCLILGTSILALLCSHRIAGPLYRIRMCINMLSEGKDILPVRLRKHDEFKELAESLDKLRVVLKDRGYLESKE
jgi:hypothetical protein